MLGTRVFGVHLKDFAAEEKEAHETVLGKGLFDAGVGMTAVTALILSWVTVGMVQLPAESLLLGHRFALLRNAVSFALSFVTALLVSWTLGVLS